MAKKTLHDIDVGQRRVLVRVDFNVPLDNGHVADDTRIRSALPTIQYLKDAGAKIVLVSHLGRPKGRVVEELKMNPVADRLQELLGEPVKKIDTAIGSEAQEAIERLQAGQVLLLENIRFFEGEELNDESFSRQLASLADIYVNDAFGTAHRAHASTAGVAGFLPSVAGFLLEKELTVLGEMLQHPKHPFVAILGGSKVSEKIPILTNLIDRVDAFVIGGGMAFTFLAAQGYDVGCSLFEDDVIPIAKAIMEETEKRNVTFMLPPDVVIAAQPEPGVHSQVVEIDAIPSDQMGLDIGPKTIKLYADAISCARTIFWNGPMGVFELPEFAMGTRAVAQAVADAGAISIVGGGDSVRAMTKFGLNDRISHISTGGGAALEFLEGKALPGVQALEDK